MSASGDLQDYTYEAEVRRDAYSIKTWTAYLEFKGQADSKVRFTIYERALAKLPASYKLWFNYLMERKEKCKSLPVNHVQYEELNNCFERALVHLHKMPRIWKEYAEHLMQQKKITQTRRVFDRALQSLPITQHVRWIWPSYMQFAKECNVPETAIRIYRRYLKIQPTHVEDFIKYLKKVGRVEEAAQALAKVVNDENFVSQHGKSRHDLWSELLRLVVRNPTKVSNLNVEAIIRSGIRRFAHEAGKLWTSLAEYHTRLAHFEKARDVYEEAVNSVATVRDFTIVWDAYVKFEETMIQARMEAAEAALQERAERREEEGKNRQARREAAARAKVDSKQMEDDISSDLLASIEAELAREQDEDEDDTADDVDIDLRMMRLDDLLSRRPILINSVLLRQNPHNVAEWHRRVKLYEEDPEKVIETFTSAVTTVDPFQAVGRPHTLWVEFAKYYEENDSVEDARVIFEKATKAAYKSVADLAAVYCEWAEMELRHNNYKGAIAVMKKAVTPPRRARLPKWQQEREQGGAAQDHLYKNTTVWSLYVDLEEAFGSVESTRAAYDRMIQLRAATPRLVISYTDFLEEHKFFEESFRAFEKGISLFTWPHVLPLWLGYLKKFTDRYKGKKIERTRDLFEQAVEKVPAAHAKDLYLLYAKFEEDYGLARRAMNVYERLCNAVEQKDKAEMYNIWIARCAEFFGVTKTREIYEKALKTLPDAHLKTMCTQFADLERKLGEIDRARKIYEYGSQFCDPRVDQAYWNTWREFEVRHGNEDTFREMLRIKRSVQAQFSTVTTANILARANVVKGETLGGTAPTGAGVKRKEPEQPTSSMAMLEAELAQKSAEDTARAAKQAQAAAETKEIEALKRAQANPDEIDLGADEPEEPIAPAKKRAKPDDEPEIEQRAVPAAVFGDALKAAQAEAELEKQAEETGALARFKKRRVQ